LLPGRGEQRSRPEPALRSILRYFQIVQFTAADGRG